MKVTEEISHENGKYPDVKLVYARTAAYFATALSLGLYVAIAGPTLPGLAEQTGVNLNRISYIFTAHSFGYLVGSLVGGRLYDRVSGRFVIASALFTIMVLMVFLPFVPLLYVMVAVFVVTGSAGGMLDVGCNTFLVWVHGSRVAPYMNGLHFCFGLGALISPLIVGGVIKSTGGISWAFWVVAIILLPSVVLLSSVSAPEIKKQKEEGHSRRSDYFLVGIISFFFFLHVGGELAFGGWIYTYALSMGLADKIVAARLNSIFWGSLTGGRLLGVPVASRVKPRYILMGSLAGCVLGSGLILLYPRSPAVMWAGTVITGFSMASLFPVSMTFSERHLHLSGKVTGMFLAGASIGNMFFPWFVGQFFESMGPRVTMFIIAVDYVLALGIFLFAVSYTRNKLNL